MHSIPVARCLALRLSPRGPQRRLANLCALAVLAGAVPLASAAGAGDASPRPERQTSIEVAPGPLGPALSTYAAQMGVLLTFDPALTQGKRTAGLTGLHTAREGLARLLAGSGLAVVGLSDGSYTLRPGAAPEVAQLAPVTVAGRHETSASDPVVGYVARYSTAGTKTDTPLRETPQSISVVGREFMEDVNAQGLGEALRYTAGVVTTEGDNHTTDIFVLRGFQLSGYGGTYRDGMKYMGNTYDGVQEPYGLERVEVLRGAASVLYGQAAPGGVINAVSKLPTAEPLHEIRAEVGNLRRRQIATDHGGSITPDGVWRYRLTALARKSDTSVDHIPDDRLYLAPALTWQPTAATSVTLLGTYQRSHTGYAYGLPAEGTLLPSPHGRIPRSRFVGEPDYDDAVTRFVDVGYRVEHAVSDTLRLRQNVRWFKSRNHMPSAAAYAWQDDDQRWIERDAQDRTDDSRNLVIDTQAEWRWRHGAVAHTLLTGVDYAGRTHRSERYNRTLAPLDLFDPQYGAQPGPREPALNSSQESSRRLGLYAQDQIKFDERWVLVLGGRHDWARSTERALFLDQEGTERNEAFTGRAGLVYLAKNGLAPFVSFSQSFEPTSGTARDGRRFEPTRGEQYEVGLRYQPDGSDWLLSASVYQLTQSNVLTPDPIAPTQFQTQTGEVRSRGLELEATLPVGPNARVVAAYAYTDARITRSHRPGEEGQRRGATPYHQASIWGDYSLADWGVPGLRVGAGVRYVGSTLGLFDTQVNVKAYTVVDAMASYAWDDWTLALHARNLTNREYVASYTYGAFYGPARAVTASLTHRW